MADPTNPNDPTYKGNPNYVWSGGRWQYVSNPATANSAQGGSVDAVSAGTPGFNLDPSLGAGGYLDMAKAGKYGKMPNAGAWNDLFRQMANAPSRDNPYSMLIANQTRPAQMALLEQMKAQAAGPSVAGAQGQMALGQNAMSALGAMGRGPLGARAALAQQAGIGGGIAADAANARLQEGMNQQRGMFGLASGVRGGDLGAAQAQAQAGLGMRGLDVGRQLAGAQMGSQFDMAQQRNAIEMFKLYQKLQQKIQQDNSEGVQRAFQTGATLLGGLI